MRVSRRSSPADQRSSGVGSTIIYTCRKLLYPAALAGRWLACRQNRCLCMAHVLRTLARYLYLTSTNWHARAIARSGHCAGHSRLLDPLVASLAAGRARMCRSAARSGPSVDAGRSPARSRYSPCRRTTSPPAQLSLAPSGAASQILYDEPSTKASARCSGRLATI